MEEKYRYGANQNHIILQFDLKSFSSNKGASIKDVRGQGGGFISQRWTNLDKGKGGLAKTDVLFTNTRALRALAPARFSDPEISLPSRPGSEIEVSG